MTDDLRALHAQSLVIADAFVADVDTADLGRTSPCEGWSLTDLLAHMIGQHRGFEQAFRDGSAPPDAYNPVLFRYAEWQASTTALVDAFAAHDLDSPVLAIELSPAPLPVMRIVGAQLIDTVVHTWDIARSLGREFTPPADLLTATVQIARAIPDQAYGPGSAFRERLPATGEQWPDVLAAVGRRVAWPD